MKAIKKIAAVLAALGLAAGFHGCDGTENDNPDKIKYTETLRVYNAGEYIDMAVVADFEKEFAVKVEYFEFESNEDMYNAVLKNPDAYDILVPSDYMIDRLIQEGRLEKLEKSKVANIANAAEEYLNPAYDPDNDYVVPYMAGTLGILYNKRYVNGVADSWAALFDAQYQGKALMIDSQRDAIGIALKTLGYSMNSGGGDELAQAKSKLQSVRFIYDESETIRDKMVAGEGAVGVVYSGDAKTAIDRNPDLAYAIPKEGSNKWVDGFVIVKNTQRLDAAHKFIDFMCRPNMAVRNMSKIGYTSPIKGAWAEFGGNKIMFPSEEELGRCEAFMYDAESAKKYDELWNDF